MARFIASVLRSGLASHRGHADFFQGPDKAIKEHAVADQFLTSFLPPEQREDWELSLGADPPDCVMTHKCGKQFGLEVTELVCEECIRLTQVERRRGSLRIGDGFTRLWDREHLERVLREGLAKKDTPARAYDFSEYWIVFHTAELVLDIDTIRELLEDSTFGPHALIDRAFILCSYDPRLRCGSCAGYPIHELSLISRG